MKKIEIPKKKKGEYRTIYLPDNKTKAKLKIIANEVDCKIASMEKNGNIDGSVLHGFHCGKSPVSNAWQHVGYDYTLSMDLEDFFDSVRKKHLKGLLPQSLIDKVFVDGAPKQGLPSSPAVCNLAAIKMDNAILKWIKKQGISVVYTRYADDLAFSFNEKELFEKIKVYVNNCVSKNGFKINHKKTRLQSASYGRREITGIMVDKESVYPSRAFKRRMRAAEHQENINSLEGMKEWAKCKTPNKVNFSEQALIYRTLLKNGKFKNTKIKPQIRAIKEIKDGNFLITNSLAYVWGMTDLADGWLSCYKNKGVNKNAPLFLSQFDVSVGVILSEKTTKYYGVNCNKIKARCIIYHTKEGVSVAMGFYGNSIPELKTKLKEHKIKCSNNKTLTCKGIGKNIQKSRLYSQAKKEVLSQNRIIIKVK